MRVMVLGLRGFPGVQGGVETHAERLYPRLAALGCELEVLVRAPYWSGAGVPALPGIRFRPLWSPRRSGAEALLHSIVGVLYAAWRRPDLLHIHAVGPALVTPLARLFGLRVVVTHHGPDYDREKWGPFARWVLRSGERLGMRFADGRIVISSVIAEIVRRKYRRDSVCIPNGVELPAGHYPRGVLAELGLTPGRYLLTVSRLVPEKRHLDLIAAFAQADLAGWKLVLVGGGDDREPYTRQLRAAAAAQPGVVLAGFRSGGELGALYAHAGLFALCSSHEGLPIALLEALSYGLPCVVSDIPANCEVGLAPEHYYRTGEVAELAGRLRAFTGAARPQGERARLRELVKSRYDWSRIARSTLAVYRAVERRRLARRIQVAWLPD